MYESHFQFQTRPFVAAPQIDAYVPAAPMEQARQTLIRCVERAEGPGLIVGPAGNGQVPLCQPIADRCYLQPFNREETSYFIRQQVQRAGGNDSLFTVDALKAVYSATDGVPRLVNQVCDHALVLSAVGGHTQIGAEAIEEAWS